MCIHTGRLLSLLSATVVFRRYWLSWWGWWYRLDVGRHNRTGRKRVDTEYHFVREPATPSSWAAKTKWRQPFLGT